MSEDIFKLLITLCLPLIAICLAASWLILAIRGGRAIQMTFKGFGVDVSIHNGPKPNATEIQPDHSQTKSTNA